MEREEAEAKAVQLAAEDPDRETHRFVARKGDDGAWAVLKINIPPTDDKLVAETRADEKPPEPDDPRNSLSRNIGGPYAAG